MKFYFLKRETGKGSVLISSEEYNSIMETLHLLKSRKTTDRILESLTQIESGDVVTKTVNPLMEISEEEM
jgi:antitoxin YefM